MINILTSSDLTYDNLLNADGQQKKEHTQHFTVYVISKTCNRNMMLENYYQRFYA